jgi:hypothetical protein
VPVPGYRRGVLSRWQGGTAAVVVTLVTCALVILDAADSAERRWWDGHAITTDTVAGLLVLLITVLVVDQVVRRRQVSDRSRAIAAQAAIMAVQARRTVQAVNQAVAQGAGDSDRDDASDELRTYMMMLLVAAPVLIDVPVSRSFLEQAQSLGGEMARVLAAAGRQKDGAAISTDRLDDAGKRLRAAADPLLQILDPETRTAALGGDSELYGRSAGHGLVRGWSHYAKDAARGACGRLGCRRLWGVMGAWGWRDWATSRTSSGCRPGSASGCGAPGVAAAASYTRSRRRPSSRCCAPRRSGPRWPTPPGRAGMGPWPGSGCCPRSGPAP